MEKYIPIESNRLTMRGNKILGMEARNYNDFYLKKIT